MHFIVLMCGLWFVSGLFAGVSITARCAAWDIGRREKIWAALDRQREER